MPLAERLACFECFPVLLWKDGAGDSCDGSGEKTGFQGRVGLVDDLELLLGDFVAAMRVGMMLLDQHLVPRLQADHGERRVEVEDRQRLVARRSGARRNIAAEAPG